MDFLLTFDVESFSIPLNRSDDETARQVYAQGLPRVLDLCAKHDIAATFYFTGEIAEKIPEAVDLVRDHAHEVGCHGYSHEVDRAFDLLEYPEQVSELVKAKKVIESVAGSIRSFRAPALRINNDTVRALKTTGFVTDSSTCPQRFDGPLTFGSAKKLKWLVMKRTSFFLDPEKSVLEIPVSAMILPFIGTTMRISPFVINQLKKNLYFEAYHTGKPVVFLCHPNECLDCTDTISTPRRTSNIIHHIFADRIRQRLKLRRLGLPAVQLMDEMIRDAQERGFEFHTALGYRNAWGRSHGNI